MKFICISSLSELLETIEFLRVGFGSNHSWAYKLFLHVSRQNSSLGEYGYVIYVDSCIVGAVLTIYQGKYRDLSGNERDVINTSSLYVNKKYRGLPSISLLNHQLMRYSKAIITSTPSEKFIDFNKRIGFKNMNSDIYRLFPSFKPSDLFPKVKILNYDVNNIFIDRFSLNNNSLTDAISYKILLNQKHYLFIVGLIKIKYLKGIPIRHFEILWSSDYTLIDKIIFKIANYFLFKFGCLYIDYFREAKSKSSLSNKNKLPRLMLIKTDSEIKYISPLGGELSLKSISL